MVSSILTNPHSSKIRAESSLYLRLVSRFNSQANYFPIEQNVYESVKKCPPMRQFNIEGYIQLDIVTEETIFFNSKFESGNLRQAFKVPGSIGGLDSIGQQA